MLKLLSDILNALLENLHEQRAILADLKVIKANQAAAAVRETSIIGGQTAIAEFASKLQLSLKSFVSYQTEFNNLTAINVRALSDRMGEVSDRMGEVKNEQRIIGDAVSELLNDDAQILLKLKEILSLISPGPATGLRMTLGRPIPR